MREFIVWAFCFTFAVGGAILGLFHCAAAPTPAQELNLGTQGLQEEACIQIYAPSDSAMTACRRHVQAKFHPADGGAQ